jgi:hypothetical protein
VELTNHWDHGKGDENGPFEPDCPCRGTEWEWSCSQDGCGFCQAAQYHEKPGRDATIEGCPCCFGDHCEKYYKF